MEQEIDERSRIVHNIWFNLNLVKVIFTPNALDLSFSNNCSTNIFGFKSQNNTRYVTKKN